MTGSQPTVPLPDEQWGRPAPAPRHRVWPWLVVAGVVLALGIGAVFAAEWAARAFVEGSVRSTAADQLDLPADHEIDVAVEGWVVPQLVRGRLEEITVRSQDVPLSDAVTGDVDVVVTDVPVRGGGPAGGAAGSLILDEEQLQRLLATVSDFPAETVGLSAPDVTMSFTPELFGISIDIEAAVEPSAVEGDIVLTPTRLRIGDALVDADEVRERFGGIADLVLRDWTVCIADDVPAGVTLTGLQVEGARLVAAFDVDGAIISDRALQEPGSCE